MPDNPGLSIIIPTLNEAASLDRQISALRERLSGLSDMEIIISDGDSLDDTIVIAQKHGCRVIRGPRGRANQLNHGAQCARFDRLLFLHADTSLPECFNEQLFGNHSWGFFTVRLSGSRPVFRLVETLISWRSSLTGIGTGDQAQFFNRAFFESIGGYPDIPLMEDIVICKMARQQVRPWVINAPVVTSSRRWEQHGVLKTILLMWWLRFAFRVGISAHRLHRIYYPRHD